MKVALEISLPLSGKIPSSSKCANITPVFKIGDKSLVTNYRPVALTSVLCKLLEGFVVKARQEHVYASGLLNPGQHGFVSGKSCVTHLINVNHQ